MNKPKYITEQMLDDLINWRGTITDLEALNLISRSMKCENVAVYDKVMDWCSQLHISAYGNRDELTIFA